MFTIFFRYVKSLQANSHYTFFFKKIRRAPPKTKEEADHRRQRSAENRAMFNRVGYRYIYNRLIESGTFNGYRATPDDSVRAIPFERALAALSLQNAVV